MGRAIGITPNSEGYSQFNVHYPCDINYLER